MGSGRFPAPCGQAQQLLWTFLHPPAPGPPPAPWATISLFPAAVDVLAGTCPVNGTMPVRAAPGAQRQASGVPAPPPVACARRALSARGHPVVSTWGLTGHAAGTFSHSAHTRVPAGHLETAFWGTAHRFVPFCAPDNRLLFLSLRRVRENEEPEAGDLCRDLGQGGRGRAPGVRRREPRVPRRLGLYGPRPGAWHLGGVPRGLARPRR